MFVKKGKRYQIRNFYYSYSLKVVYIIPTAFPPRRVTKTYETSKTTVQNLIESLFLHLRLPTALHLRSLLTNYIFIFGASPTQDFFLFLFKLLICFNLDPIALPVCGSGEGIVSFIQNPV